VLCQRSLQQCGLQQENKPGRRVLRYGSVLLLKGHLGNQNAFSLIAQPVFSILELLK
jgi:hypothetical protein